MAEMSDFVIGMPPKRFGGGGRMFGGGVMGVGYNNNVSVDSPL